MLPEEGYQSFSYFVNNRPSQARKNLNKARLKPLLALKFAAKDVDSRVSVSHLRMLSLALASKSSLQIRKKVTNKRKFTINFREAGIAQAPLFAIVRMWNCLSAAHGVLDMHRKESLNFYQLWEVSNEIF